MKERPELWLVVEEGARAGATLRLEGHAVLLGRAADAALRMAPHEDRLVSARHARLRPAGDGWLVEDLGSRNGTFVNGRAVEAPRALRPGDRIELGRTGPIVLFTDRPREAAVREPSRKPPPPTRSWRRTEGRRLPFLLGGLVVAAVAGVLAYGPGGGADRADPTPDQGDVTPTAEPTGTAGPASGAADDSAAARQAREIAALREEVALLREGVRRAEAEADDLRAALDAAERGGASADSIRALEQRLQTANAALRRQQLAASMDFESIGAAVVPATVQVYAEFQGEHVVVATGFGVNGRGGLLTSRHVVRDDDGRALLRVGIRYPGREGVVPATVTAVSPTADLAYLELDRPRDAYPALEELNDRPDTLAQGTPVAIAGFPLGGGAPDDGRGPRPLLSAGVLTGWDGDYLEIEGYGRSGASGSPIVDGDGRLVGVLAGGRTGPGGERLYALPAPRIVSFLRSVSAIR